MDPNGGATYVRIPVPVASPLQPRPAPESLRYPPADFPAGEHPEKESWKKLAGFDGVKPVAVHVSSCAAAAAPSSLSLPHGAPRRQRASPTAAGGSRRTWPGSPVPHPGLAADRADVAGRRAAPGDVTRDPRAARARTPVWACGPRPRSNPSHRGRSRSGWWGSAWGRHPHVRC